MQRKFFHDISASAFQVIINQVSSVFIFFILSKQLSKSVFGEINWFLAVLMIIFAILGFGMDQVVLRKVAAGNEASEVLHSHMFHVLLMGSSFISLIWLAWLFSGNHATDFLLILLLSIGQFFIFLSSPFKQIANGRELFRTLLLMTTTANLVKLVLLLILLGLNIVSLETFIIIYMVAAAAELLVCLYISKFYLNLKIRFPAGGMHYKKLLQESLPQLGVIICNAGIARIDWVLLGILSTTTILAEYSFAYKVFEMSTIPLLIIAPLLLPKITKWVYQGSANQRQIEKDLLSLARLEITGASLVILLLNIAWAPLIDLITNNKYGVVNSNTILILSCSAPFLYVNNILWSLNFAQGRTKIILIIFTFTFAITTIGDLFLIPVLQATGAAIAYLTAIIFQTLHFIFYTKLNNLHRIGRYLVTCMGIAFLSGIIAKSLHRNTGLQLVIAAGCFLLLISVSRLIRFNDYFKFKSIQGNEAVRN
jgi:O-antigen/teichoic acid export membrane protein